jgi:filamentous hemagglutinin family protein
MGSPFWKNALMAPILLSGICLCRFATAEVVFDGTAGPAGTLSGEMVIPDTQGTTVGDNLFHSFSTFNINSGESALFTGPSAISNIISRVTGANASTIDGSLNHNMPNAHFWLLNPNGILFGPNASLPTMGAFHATTADYLLFEDGGRFGANTSLPENRVLSVTHPSAFGFIGSNPGSITVNNSELIVEVGTGLSLVGGDIDIRGSSTEQLVANSGEINLVSVSSAGEAIINANGVDIDPFSQGGVIRLQESVIRANGVVFTESSEGAIFIRGGELVAESSEISANTYENEGARGKISIDVKQDITLSASTIDSTINDLEGSSHINLSAGGDILLQNNSAITTTSHSYGDSGDVSISAQNLTVASQTDITTTAHSPGNAGNISINVADNLSISDATSVGVGSSTLGLTGNAGNIDITANTVNLDGGFLFTFSSSQSLGASGDLSIQANTLEMSNNSSIFSDTAGGGEAGTTSLLVRDGILMTEASRIYNITSGGLLRDAGNIFIETSELTLDNQSFIVTSTLGSGSGNAGNLQVVADRVTLSSSYLRADAAEGSTGQGGDISITASESIKLSNSSDEDNNLPYISATTSSSLNGGDITLRSSELVINEGYISSATNSSGDAGNIDIDVDSLTLSEGGIIASSALTADTTGNGGSIHINAQNALTIEGFSEIDETVVLSHIATATAGAGNAGDIRISAPVMDIDQGWLNASSSGSGASGSVVLTDIERLSLTSGGTILSRTLATGEGGQVDIDAHAIHISGVDTFYGIHSGINTNSVGSAHAGDVTLKSEHLVLDQGGRLESSTTGSGNAGNIFIGTPESPVGNLTLRDNSIISASTTGLGNAGNIHINATGAVALQSQGASITSSASGIDSNALGSAGTITLNAHALNILSGGTITTDTQSHHGTPANIQISVNDLLIEGENTNTLQAIAALENAQQPQVLPTGITSNASADQQGGSITVNATDQVILLSGVISASGSGYGGGGDVNIGSSASPVALIAIDGNSAILARAQRGNGGNIYLSPDTLLRDRTSRISADSTHGNAGVVEVDNVEQDITHSILDLDIALIVPNQLIGQACDIHQTRQQSRLILNTQGGLRLSPGDYIPSKMSQLTIDERKERNPAAH